MPRRHRDQTFRKSDVVRAYRAAIKAEVPNPIVKIDCVNRTITIVSGAPRDADQINEWDDEVCAPPSPPAPQRQK
jgi:hypothetical protein